MKTIIVEGNVGAGKSTLLHVLKQYLNVQVLCEPLDLWQQVGGAYNLLELFYSDPKRWAYSFQTYAIISHQMQQQEVQKNNADVVLIVERSVFSYRYCFAKNCYEQGYMNALEWRLYQECFEWLISEYTAKPDGIIYLRVEPEICYARLQRRARCEESAVLSEYLVQLHNLHEAWLGEDKSLTLKDSMVPVVTIDGDKEFETDIVQKELFIDTLMSSFSLSTKSMAVTHRNTVKEHAL